MDTLLDNKIVSHRAKVSSLFLIYFHAEVSDPLALWGMFESKLKAQPFDLRFFFLKIVPR